MTDEDRETEISYPESHSQVSVPKSLTPWRLAGRRLLWLPCVRVWSGTAQGSPTSNFYSEDNLALGTQRAVNRSSWRRGSSWMPEIVGVGRVQEPPGLGVDFKRISKIHFPSPWTLAFHFSPLPHSQPHNGNCVRARNQHGVLTQCQALC